MGDRNAQYNKWWRAADSVYMPSWYTPRELAQQHSRHRMANGTRSGCSTSNHYRISGGSCGHSDQSPHGRSQGSSSHNDHQTSAVSSCGMQSNETGRQWHQSGGDSGIEDSSDGQQMWACNDVGDEPLSPHCRTHIVNNSINSSSLNSQGAVMTHPARHVCLTDTF